MNPSCVVRGTRLTVLSVVVVGVAGSSLPVQPTTWAPVSSTSTANVRASRTRLSMGIILLGLSVDEGGNLAGGLSVLSGQHMPVEVGGDGGVGVAHPLTHDLHRDAGGQGSGHVRMTDIV